LQPLQGKVEAIRMISSIYESYGAIPFIIAFLVIIILFQRFSNKGLQKRADEMQRLYAESESKRKEEKEKGERLNKEVEKHHQQQIGEYSVRLNDERRQHREKAVNLIEDHKKQISELTEKNNAEISSLKDSHDKEVQSLQTQLSNIEEEKSREITKLSRSYAENIRQYKKQIADLNTQREQEEAEHKREIKDIESKLRDQLLEKDKQIKDSARKIAEANQQLDKRNAYFKKVMGSNLDSIPFLAGLMSDYLTYDLEVLANQLDWGNSIQRREKEIKIRELRKEVKEKLEVAKQAEYELAYLKELYPEIEEIIETDYRELFDKPSVEKLLSKSSESEVDSTRQYLNKNEWDSMSQSDRNQLALDRYIESRKKSKWQIGRDYELYVGYSMYESQGWQVRYYGSEKKLEDLGRDLIAKKGIVAEIVQCKYWSKEKTIHEKHIFQLFGTKVCYEMEHEDDNIVVNSKFVTNTVLSTKAKEIAELLGIEVIENYEIGSFPRIKCNIGKDEKGRSIKIYHLPMDQQYDNVIIEKDKGEMVVSTVKEAEKAGFRRAYKWIGD